MAGSFIEIDLTGYIGVTSALNRLIKKGQSLEPALLDIGEYLLESHEQRFQQQVAPDGTAWEKLSTATIERKAKTNQSDKILRGYGTLADSLHYQIHGNQLQFGSNQEYAAMHQFGGKTAANSMIPGRTIPERPFLGVSSEDESEILDILRKFLG